MFGRLASLRAPDPFIVGMTNESSVYAGSMMTRRYHRNGLLV